MKKTDINNIESIESIERIEDVGDNEIGFFKEQSKNDLISFSVFTDMGATNPFKAYNPKEYHEIIAYYLMKVHRGEIKKLMISIPPQHGKTQLSSINFPARVLGSDGTQQIALASYGANLSENNSQKCRDLIRSENYKFIFGDILKEDSQARNERHTKDGGRYTAVGIGGALTGKAVDLLLIDDPLKDHEEAQSQLIRQKIWDWYTSVALSRLHSESKQVIIMTRWHEDDLCGRLIELESNDWTILNIPVYKEDGNTIRPERFPKKFIDEKRKTSGEMIFQSLYMGDPINKGGGIFKQEYFLYYDKWDIINPNTLEYKKKLDIVCFVDPAISIKQTADYTAITTIGLDRESNNIYIIDVFVGRITPDDIINKIFNIVDEFNPLRVGIEDVAYQRMLIDEVSKQMNMRGKYFLLDGVRPQGEKEARISAILAGRYASYKIFHLKNNPNFYELESQLLKFPNSKHDDIMDSLASAIRMLETFNITKRQNNYSINNNQKKIISKLTGQILGDNKGRSTTQNRNSVLNLLKKN